MQIPRNPPRLLALFARVANAIDRHFTAPTTLGGVRYTPGELKALFVLVAAQVATADDALARYRAAVLAKRTAVRHARQTLLLIRSDLFARHGRAAGALLADFELEDASVDRDPATLRCPDSATFPHAETP